MTWYFEQFPLTGGAGAGAYRNALAGAGVPPTDLFVREVIQNSVDAALDPADGVLVRFRSLELDQSDVEALAAELRLGAPGSPSERGERLGVGDFLEQLTNNRHALLVEDYRTSGLGGTLDPILPPLREDNFRRLALEFGVTDVAQGRGGTFGYGKGVYWASSEVWTVILYSRFKPSARTGEVGSRLIGVSWFKGHNWENPENVEERFTGRALFGVRNDDACLPFEGDEADSIAGRLGFSERGEGDYGTSALILAPQLNTSELAAAVETNWWPRIADGLLEVDLPDGSQPSPENNDDVRPFLQAYRLAKGKAEPTEEELAKAVSYKQRELGRLGVVLREPDGPTTPGIALIRGPGMVVEYYQGLQMREPPYAGVFVASDWIDDTLAASEPPPHDRWDHNTIRTLSPSQRQDILKLLEKVRGTTQTFLSAHREPRPEPPPTCDALEKMFGKFLATNPDAPPPPPPRSPDIFSVRFAGPVKRRVDPNLGEVQMHQEFTVEVKDEAFTDDGEVLIQVDAWVDLLVDDGKAEGRKERVHMNYFRCSDPETGAAFMGEHQDDATRIIFAAKETDAPFEFELLSDPLPGADYAAKLEITVERKV
jgi:hypothetical protein